LLDDLARELTQGELLFQEQQLGPAHAKRNALQMLAQEAHKIEGWADHSFVTADARTYELFLDGTSILHRLLARFVLISSKKISNIEQLYTAAGMIREAGSDDPPLIFTEGKFLDLWLAWIELHRSHQAPLTCAEVSALRREGFVVEDDPNEQNTL
jgi:hypothetical protein